MPLNLPAQTVYHHKGPGYTWSRRSTLHILSDDSEAAVRRAYELDLVPKDARVYRGFAWRWNILVDPSLVGKGVVIRGDWTGHSHIPQRQHVAAASQQAAQALLYTELMERGEKPDISIDFKLALKEVYR